MASWPLWESRGSCWILRRDILLSSGGLILLEEVRGRLEI